MERIVMSTKELTLSRTTEVLIENKLQPVVLTIEGYTDNAWYYVQAITSTGFNLCTNSYGYFKYNTSRNTRLRSAKSIEREMNSILDRYEASIRSIADRIILTSRTIAGKISGSDFYGPNTDHWFNVNNIHSMQSRQSVSWYHHDIFNQGEIEVFVERNKEGQLRYYADEKKLYNQDKLNQLFKSDAYSKRNFAFFFYDELARLVGAPYNDTRAMSGLFAQE
jgi:hypothetical protein